MDHVKYMKCLQEAATRLAMEGHKWADGVGVIDLRATFTTTEVDEEEHTVITMCRTVNATIIELTTGEWRIDEIRKWEVTTEEDE